LATLTFLKLVKKLTKNAVRNLAYTKFDNNCCLRYIATCGKKFL